MSDGKRLFQHGSASRVLPIVTILVEVVLAMSAAMLLFNESSIMLAFTQNKFFYVLAMGWINCGGFVRHYLPNAILYLPVAPWIEWKVGSLNMLALWLVGYFFSMVFAFSTTRGKFWFANYTTDCRLYVLFIYSWQPNLWLLFTRLLHLCRLWRSHVSFLLVVSCTKSCQYKHGWH